MSDEKKEIELLENKLLFETFYKIKMQFYNKY